MTWALDDPTGETPIEGTWRDPAGHEHRVERWDIGERNVLEGLAKFDLTDVYRKLHKYQVAPERGFSWYWKGKGRRIGRRFDHVFASRDLNAVRCQYLHSLRETGLSDHSAIEVDFQPAGAVDE